MEYTVKRFGKHAKTLKLGLHLIIPIIDRVGYKLNIREQIMDVPSQEVVTKDDRKFKSMALCFFKSYKHL